LKQFHLLFVFSLLAVFATPFPVSASTSPAPAPNPSKAASGRPVLLTGEVESSDSQAILVPPSNSSPVVLRNFVADGTVVKKGDVVLRIETQGVTSIRQLQIEMEQAQARAERETADLEVKQVAAEKDLATATAALAKAHVDAALPKAQVSSLDYDRYQAELDRAERDLKIKQTVLTNATDAVTRRRSDGDLEVKKLQINLAFTKARLEQSEVRATQDGAVVHGYSEWRGDRFEEGSSAFPGNSAGQIIGNGQMLVRAWAVEADRPYLFEGQAVRLTFDALQGRSLIAHVSKIANAPQARAIWGNARYFPIDIALPPDHGIALVPGMSVLVEPQTSAPEAASHAPASPGDLTVEGEIASRVALPIAPPTIQDVWQYTLAQLAPEGSIVKAGQPVATFEATEIMTQLDTLRSKLKEKQRELDKIKLDQAEAGRSGELAVAEAKSNAERAARKASVPKELIRRIDYDKLVIDRELSAHVAELAARQRDAEAHARMATLQGTVSEIAQLQESIDNFNKGQQALTVLAPRTGMVLYRLQFNGEKFSTGNQVWMGLSVATLVDPDQLIVNAKVPEAQAAAVHVGQRAQVSVASANLTLAAHVSALGQTYHGKSKSQSIVVRDVQLQFDDAQKGMKPGSAVQVQLLADGTRRPESANAKEVKR
jgi:multidrug resistance efflux pump